MPVRSDDGIPGDGIFCRHFIKQLTGSDDVARARQTRYLEITDVNIMG